LIPIKTTYKEFLNDVNANNSLAFKNVYNTYWERLYLYAYKILKDKNQCEDLVQEIFISFWNKKDKEHIQNIPAYFFQATRFQIFKIFRDKKMTLVEIEHFSQLIKETNATDGHLELTDLENEIHGHLNKLPKRCREIFILSRFEHLSHKEIAEKLGVSTQTVKNQIVTALKYLREHLEGHTFFCVLSILFII